MARYTKAKHKLARREGINILGKGSASLERRLNVFPGSHGKRRARKLSEFGIQLREKQKLKRIYGLLERQFRKYVFEAQRQKINTEDALIGLLESRLDNVVFRLGYGKSRPQARQMVSHRHVLVNDRVVNIPSYKVSEGDKITVSEKFPVYTPDENAIEAEIPSFLNKEDKFGKLVRKPLRDDVVNPVDYQLVIEFYSR